MDRRKTIQFLKKDHKKLADLISKLTEKQMKDDKVQGNWCIKDIIAHISAWNWELLEQTEKVLTKKKLWYNYPTETDFNKKAIELRESWSVEKVLSEWEESFTALIARIENLSEKEWMSGLDEEWPEGGKVTVSSIFGYRYRGAGHEGGHAKVIQSFFNLHKSKC